MPLRSAQLLTVALLAFAAAAPAQAAVGVEKTSQRVGAPGDAVTITLGCGFCYPPCKGHPGHREPSPCMLGTKATPPTAFPISLVPVEKTAALHHCGPDALCSPQATSPPRRAPFRFLGDAASLNDVHQETGRVPVPRYVLEFTIPNLRPGTYTYVIYCDVCQRGQGGSLVVNPGARLWNLRVRPPSPRATVDR